MHRLGKKKLNPPGTKSVTCASEVIRWAGKEKLLDQVVGFSTLGDSGLDVIGLDPVGEPLQVAVAVERVRADGLSKINCRFKCSKVFAALK